MYIFLIYHGIFQASHLLLFRQLHTAAIHTNFNDFPLFNSPNYIQLPTIFIPNSRPDIA